MTKQKLLEKIAHYAYLLEDATDYEDNNVSSLIEIIQSMNYQDDVSKLTQGKKEYELSFSYTEGCNITIKANSMQEAKQKLEAFLSDNGNIDLLHNNKTLDLDYINRDWDIYEGRE